MSKRLPYKKYNKLKHRVNERDKGLCVVCHGPGYDVHHVVFRSQGGEDSMNNLVVLCRECHAIAHGIRAKDMRVQLLKYLAKVSDQDGEQ